MIIIRTDNTSKTLKKIERMDNAYLTILELIEDDQSRLATSLRNPVETALRSNRQEIGRGDPGKIRDVYKGMKEGLLEIGDAMYWISDDKRRLIKEIATNALQGDR